jgi:hypothetical protein
MFIFSLETLYSPLKHSAVSPSFCTVLPLHLIFFPAFIHERITGFIADEQKAWKVIIDTVGSFCVTQTPEHN